MIGEKLHTPIANLPRHIAIIPDGNRRWAEHRGLSLLEGYQEGARRFFEIAEEVFNMGIPYYTFGAASKKNLTSRNQYEVDSIVSVLKNSLLQKIKYPHFTKNDVKFRIIGKWKDILKDFELENIIKKIEEKTAEAKKYYITILLGCDGKEEIIESIKCIMREGHKPEDINDELIEKYLWTGCLPSVDLVIRTGGEPHNSANFMTWHTGDSQLYFTKKLWPEFDKNEFKNALHEYSRRVRESGGAQSDLERSQSGRVNLNGSSG